MIRDFEYFAPETLAEALELLDAHREEARVFAGGQSLLILMRQGLIAPRYVVDIKGISELSYISPDGDGGLRIGALTTHRQIEQSPVIKDRFPVLAEMEHRVATIQTRNWGTIGGNLCHADPAGDPMPVFMALNARMKIAGLGGERTVAVEDFVVDFFETALQPGEMLTEIEIPKGPPRTGSAYSKFSIVENDLGIVGTAVSITLGPDDGVCGDVRIALGAAAPTPIRVRKAEEVLRGRSVTDGLLGEAGEIAAAEADPISDIAASAEYRRELIKVMVARVGAEALAQAKSG